MKSLQAILERQQVLRQRQQALLKSQQELLEQLRRDNAYNRKLWIAVARKLDLFDDLQDPA